VCLGGRGRVLAPKHEVPVAEAAIQVERKYNGAGTPGSLDRQCASNGHERGLSKIPGTGSSPGNVGGVGWRRWAGHVEAVVLEFDAWTGQDERASERLVVRQGWKGSTNLETGACLLV
jgi:hypothetical protein